ncbi:MAG: NAD-dependent epimerase/dehydratase family protein [Candidatus Rhabdochlamydia sp.]
MLVAVIGASGLIGNNLCRALLQEGYSVKALIHQNSHSLEDLALEQVKGDILDPEGLRAFLQGCDVVFHAAGKISIDGDKDGMVHTVNVEGTKNVVEACLATGISRLIYFSSIHAFKQSPEGLLDESRPLVGSEGFKHDIAKSDAEKEVLKGIAQGLETVILIPTAAIGPYDFAPSLLGQGLITLYNRKLPTLIDGGFDWIDVRDIAKAALVAMKKGNPGNRYVISGVWQTVKDLSLLIEEIAGVPSPKFTSPHWLAKIGIPLAKVLSRMTQTPMLYTHETLEVLLRCNRNISSLKARRELGFYPRPLKETLQDTLRWYKQAGKIE